MAIIVPNTGSTFGAAACVVGSNKGANTNEGRWVWLGFRAPLTASGSCTFYRTGASTSGCEIMSISVSPGGFSGMHGPFNSACGIYIAGISGGCAIVWMKQ